jgi:hypothetical protein
MDNLTSSIHHYVDSFDTGCRMFVPVRVAILDSGFDPENPFLLTGDQGLDPRIKYAQSFVHESEPHDIRDNIGHGTHALGLLLKVTTCAEIYIAKIADRETLDRNTYDDIAKAGPGFYCEADFAMKLMVYIGYQPRCFSMESGHYINVIWHS